MKFKHVLKYVVMRIEHHIVMRFIARPSVLTIDETIEKIISGKVSVSRFGDGELNMLDGVQPTGFQENRPELCVRLIEVLNSDIPEHIVCLPGVFGSLGNLKMGSQIFWMGQLRKNVKKWMEFIPSGRQFYNTFMTRFYIAWRDSHKAGSRYDKLKMIWKDRDVLLVEGEKSRMGIGNDLLSGVKSLDRFLCPACNAFSYYDEILEGVKKFSKGRLVLIVLGPTATILAHDLAMEGIQGVDLGHLDVEYEWFLQGAEKKTVLKYKYVNEVAGEVEELDNPAYFSSIVCRVGGN